MGRQWCHTDLNARSHPCARPSALLPERLSPPPFPHHAPGHAGAHPAQPGGWPVVPEQHLHNAARDCRVLAPAPQAPTGNGGTRRGEHDRKGTQKENANRRRLIRNTQPLLLCLTRLPTTPGHQLIVNGPGSCIPLCLVAVLASILGLQRTYIVYIESICRVSSLSLSARILRMGMAGGCAQRLRGTTRCGQGQRRTRGPQGVLPPPPSHQHRSGHCSESRCRQPWRPTHQRA